MTALLCSACHFIKECSPASFQAGHSPVLTPKLHVCDPLGSVPRHARLRVLGQSGRSVCVICFYFISFVILKYIDLFWGRHVKVRGQLLGVISLPIMWILGLSQTQVVRVNGKHLYPLSEPQIWFLRQGLTL